MIRGSVTCFAIGLLLCLAVEAQTNSSLQSIVLRDITLIDARSRSPEPHMVVVITGNRITAVEPLDTVSIPQGARVLEGQGKYLIPGLWDMHVHLSKAGERALPLFIANGVTSVRDMGGDFELLLSWREQIAKNQRLGPRVKTAGPILESESHVRSMIERKTIEPIARTRVPVPDPQSAEEIVERFAKMGVDFIKVRTVGSPQIHRAIGAAAQRVGLPMVGHAWNIPPEELLRVGQRSIEHALYPPLQKRPAAERKKLLRRLAERGIAYVPTMVNFYDSLTVPYGLANTIVNQPPTTKDRRRRCVHGYLLEDWREQLGERRRGIGGMLERLVMKKIYGRLLRDLREMHRSDVRILPGTDVAVLLIYPGYALHDELGYFVEKLGMTPFEALRSATLYSAEFLGMHKDLGTVEKAKIADLVVLDANPLEDIRNTRRIYAVIVNGRLLDRHALDALIDQSCPAS